MLKTQERQALLRASLKGIHNSDLLALYSYKDLLLDFMETGQVDPRLQRLISQGSMAKLKKARDLDLDQAQDYLFQRGIGALVLEDDFYPDFLARIENPPVLVYYIGDLQVLERPSLGIVGARKHTDYGRRVTEDVLSQAQGLDLVTISGLALGIDGLCHTYSMENDLATVAVLGNGIDTCYPKRHRRLWEEVKAQGLVLSEYPPGSPALPAHFPERNRIIAALSQALLVIEAQERSGSLITARLAASMGRQVFAVPGNIDSLYSQGCNALIKDGAVIYSNMEDLISYMGWDLSPSQGLDWERIKEDLSPEEAQVLQSILDGQDHVDLMAIKLPLDMPRILATLTILEMKGYIASIGQGRYRPSL